MEKEQFKRTFRAVKPKKEFHWMDHSRQQFTSKTRRIRFASRPAVAACFALFFAVSGSSIAYAANFAGFRDVVQIWISGKYVKSTIEETGEGQFTVTDPDGESFVVGGFGENGEPISGEEAVEYLEGPDVVRDEDGKVWFQDQDYRLDITEDISDGEARVLRNYGDEKKYIVITVDKDGCFGMSFSDKSFEDALR